MDDMTLAAWLDVTVLITAPSRRARRRGARLIHQKSSRYDRPFVTIRCGRFQNPMAERDLTCQLVKASSGTVFLDDVDHMSRGWQDELTAFLEFQQQFRQDRRDVKPLIRIIAGTAAPLARLVSTGGFKEGLFYRLNVLHVDLGTLEERFEMDSLSIGA
jgi:DNA-binding NtrC family response regulator